MEVWPSTSCEGRRLKLAFSSILILYQGLAYISWTENALWLCLIAARAHINSACSPLLGVRGLINTYRTFHGYILPYENTTLQHPISDAITALLNHLTSYVSNFWWCPVFKCRHLEPEESVLTTQPPCGFHILNLASGSSRWKILRKTICTWTAHANLLVISMLIVILTTLA